MQASVALANTLHTPASSSSSSSSSPTFLVIGLGAGHVASVFQSLFGMRGDVVEHSEAVVQLAATYFHFLPSRRVHAQTAHAFVSSLHFDEASGACRLQGEYDVVAVDIFDASNTLSSLSLYTQSSLSALACTLSPRGVLSLSLVYSRRPPHLRSPHSLYLTLASIFPHILAYHDGASSSSDNGVGNMVFLASHASFHLDVANMPLPTDFSEEVHVEEEEGEEKEGRLALQYAFGFWRDQIKRRKFPWKGRAPQSDSKGKPLYKPAIITGQPHHTSTAPASDCHRSPVPDSLLRAPSLLCAFVC